MAQAVQCEHVGPWRDQGVHAFEPSAATLRTLAKACLRMLWYPHASLVSYQYILKKALLSENFFSGTRANASCYHPNSLTPHDASLINYG